MNVYLVYWCNNEPYEDYNEAVTAVFATEEGAKRYIASCGYKPHECFTSWEKRHLTKRYDSKPDEFGEYYSMWVRGMMVKE